ncbi:21203_t:CDS:2 [Entrophospora sp. SA101]|nr:21203_t:CDS:2 [Entrophospora sp. SA101]
MSKKEQYSHLQTQLEAQSSLCHTIAAHYLKSGNKKQAALYLRYKNSFKADLNSLVSYSNHDKDVPAFHYQEVSYEIENIFPELAANDMEICIERAWNLGNKEVNGNDVVAYVNWNVAWPPEGSPGAGSGKGDTSTSDRGMNPEFNFKKRIDIVRSRPFQRYLERKKATFEVFHYKGFLRKSISLGKATIKLDTLLKKSEIHDVLELVDHVRKPTGGKLEIRIRLRTPYSQSEIITKTEKWLIIDDVENIASNLVLQNEIELITNQITTLEAQRKPIPEDLLDRQNELEIKMNLLLISVQTNELTMAEYIERVKASIVNCKKLALFFKKAGKLDEAKKALRRSKIMEDEVKEVEEAIKNGALEM